MDTLSGRRLLILGLARQGKALARFAAGVGARVTVSDLRPAEKLAAELAELADCEIDFMLGDHPLSLIEQTDVLAVSGGVPLDIPLVQAARSRGIPVTNDSHEFMKRTPAPVVGITGSAGKTTTTSLAGLMSQLSGRKTWVGGNIGQPLITSLAEMTAGDLVVQELSSFQLELWHDSPQVAAVLNITPNHLDRHKTMAAYTAAKANILRHQRPSDVAVLGADDAGAMGLRGEVNGRLRLFSRQQTVEDGAFVRDQQIWLRGEGVEQVVCPLSAIRLRGAHNLSNVLAAVTLADSASVPIEAIRRAIGAFTGVEHRLELVRVIEGVQYVNDSIATAPERVLAALDAFDEPLVLLAGGKDKQMVWDSWATAVSRRVQHVILFGALAGMLEGLLHQTGRPDFLDGSALTRVPGLAEAVAVARQVARRGDVVLLSPGGTSYDSFTDFAERGELYRRLVAEIVG